MLSLFDLASQDVELRRVARAGGGEWCGPCPACQGRDRFHVWPEKGRYWCRQCNRKGDAIQYLRDFHGMSFAEAKKMIGLDDTPRFHAARREYELRRAVREKIKQRYHAWCRQQLLFYADLNREMLARKEMAEIALQQAIRLPSWYTAAEILFWQAELVSTQEEISSIESDLDIFTYDKLERLRFELFRRRQVNGDI